MKKGDLFIVAFGLLIALGAYFAYNIFASQTEQLLVVIKSEGQVVKTIPCHAGYSESYQLSNDYGTNNIAVDNGKVDMTSADCHNQICVKSGVISKAGQSIICLPHRVSVEIVGNELPEVDDISY